MEVPIFASLSVPDAEQPALQHLQASLFDMPNYHSDFEAALSLLDFCLANRMHPQLHKCIRGWFGVAGRDGAMSLYHFLRAADGIRTSLRSCETIDRTIDRRKLKAAVKRFNNAFPNVTKMRHSVAHAAELNDSLEGRATNAFSGEHDSVFIKIEKGAKGVTIRNSFQNRSFTNTFEGEIITYELSAETLSELGNILQEFLEPFRELEKTAKAERRARREAQALGKQPTSD